MYLQQIEYIFFFIQMSSWYWKMCCGQGASKSVSGLSSEEMYANGNE